MDDDDDDDDDDFQITESDRSRIRRGVTQCD